ncbi:leucine-rich repeat flightless-interacting protein 1 isoform X6 [Scophthalmus maximus]|uniref:leucine-rich repeat flightless-interacting protein 1 isoform X6 n=1 Tax=Scophthalmus maximus TaxID=52904 RepID=UPI001FA8B609|nr:leucine-rich repeat flightless-interacting protein 1 isoform X6 [Scophthalmus maximus]
MGTQGAGRKRSTKKERSTAEDDALNLIAREAEARLAAKRAARAEAREIRMKELERQQKEIFQVQKKYYGLNTKLDERVDNRWGDIEQWMEDSERYSRSSQITTLSDDDERMSVGSRGSVRSDLDAVGAYGGGDSSLKRSKKKKKHKHKDRNGYDDDYSVLSSRSSRLSDESRASRSSRTDLTSPRLSEDNRVSRASRVDLQPTSYSSSDLYGLNGLSSSRNPGSTFNGYQPLEYTSYRSSGSRASSRAGSARASPVVEDRDYLEKGSRAGSALTAATLTSSGGTSSRRGSGETAITVDAETSIREIKEIHELKDQIQDVETKYTQNLKEVKETLAEVEEKYRKAMVSNAQLDNEKNNLMYQVDTLKDSLMELEELLSESRRGHEDKVKECEREKYAHGVLQFQFNEMKETLKQSEELLSEIRQLRMKQDGFVREISDLQETVEWKDKKIGALERQKEYSDAIRTERDELREEVVQLKDILKKHGIVLGPDLNINGDVGEAEVDGLPSGDSARQPAQDSQSPPAEGNSMLGNTEEAQLRSSGEEEVDPDHRHGIVTEEVGANQLSSDALCDDDVSTLASLSEEQPTDLLKEEDGIGESGLCKDLNVDIIDHPITEDKDLIFVILEPQEMVTSAKENVPETETPTGGHLVQTSDPEVRETETKSSNFHTHSGDFRQTGNKQGNQQEDAEESNLRNAESHPQQKVLKDIMREDLPPEIISAISYTELQQEPGNVEEAENDEAEETPNKSQGSSASGKKKKKKRRGKKKGSQQKDGTEKEKSKTGEDVESAKGHKGLTEEPIIDHSVTEIEESKTDQFKTEQDRQHTEETEAAAAAAAEPTETFKESKMDHVTNVHDEEQTGEAESVDEEIIVVESETLSHVEIREDHVTDEQNKDQSETVEMVQEVAPTETFPHVDTVKELGTEPIKNEQDKEQTMEAGKSEEGHLSACDSTDTSDRTDHLEQEPTSSVDNSGQIIHSESEVVDDVEDEVVSADETKPECTADEPDNSGEENTEAESGVPANESESINHPEGKELASASPSYTNDVGLQSSSDAEPPSEPPRLSDETPIRVPDKDPVDLKRENEKSASLTQSPDTLDTEESLLETVVEHLEDVGSQTLECVEQTVLEAEMNTFDEVNTLEPRKDATDAGSSSEQELGTEEHPEHGLSPIDRDSDASLHALVEQVHDLSKDEAEDPSEPTQQGGEEEEHSGDEEGQSFDFDELDIEAAVETAAPKNQEEEIIEEGIEVLSDESNDGRSEPNENTQNKPAEGNEQESAVLECDQADALDEESETMPQGKQKSLAQEEATADGARHVAEEGPVLSVEELGVAEEINQATSLPVEEGLDAMTHEVQGDDLVSPMSADKVARSKEPPSSGKDVRKTNKKGKSKGKEECKMS